MTTKIPIPKLPPAPKERAATTKTKKTPTPKTKSIKTSMNNCKAC